MNSDKIELNIPLWVRIGTMKKQSYVVRKRERKKKTTRLGTIKPEMMERIAKVQKFLKKHPGSTVIEIQEALELTPNQVRDVLARQTLFQVHQNYKLHRTWSNREVSNVQPIE